MGIPKFFRWISERYPLCSQLITENRIPEFDNLYLDMNGIIHNCSHPNDSDVRRIPEDKIFLDIFNYIDHLFTKIKPKKLFFMAVDGVAPRAKMNQQRARRFRTARDAAEAAKKAESKGETLPEEPPFDSNCITPGTEFMNKLSIQLQYFINKKVTEDSEWRDVKVVLSGHEVPGEGEHKIMDYIRKSKAQDDYDPNVRHCLYGLDADLIMLGLLSHDPHFALLREEVLFGSSKKKKPSRGVESQNFYLMHLSLLREYLDLEFSSIKEMIHFEYDLERIIDDFVLLALFVGNDFLPHLPNLHIAEGALGLMFHVYKKVLPITDGYINDGGILDIKRLEMVFKELTTFERRTYEDKVEDIKWFKGKQQEKILEIMEEERRNKELVLTPEQREIYDKIKDLTLADCPRQIHFSPDYPARDRAFIKNLAKELKIFQTVLEDGENKYLFVENDPDETDEEIIEMREKVFEKYEAAEVVEDDIEALEEREKQNDEKKFIDWKKNYYKEKMNIDYEDPDQMEQIIGSYIEGLQWVLHYYYNGVVSWRWFYPYHYSPKISDLYDLERYEISFFYDAIHKVGEPFKPFEQLMGVLPEGSKRFLPMAYQDLLTDPDSPIIDFYPTDFELDLNGKKHEWEAIVLIPFIDQNRLLSALKEREDQLTDKEKQRNTNGESLMFTYDQNMTGVYPSSLPGFFPDIHHCHCRMETYNLPSMDGRKPVKGLCDGVKAMAGFPSLKTLPQNTEELKQHGVNVFNSESKNETMVITICNQFEDMKIIDIARSKVGKRIFVDWPFLKEGLVEAISDEHNRYELNEKINRTQNKKEWQQKAEKCELSYSKKYGVITGAVKIMVHVKMLKGLKSTQDGALVKEYVEGEQDFAIQTTTDSVECEDPRYEEKPALPLAEEFPINTEIFYLGNPYYGCPGVVSSNIEKNLAVKLIVDKNFTKEPNFGSDIAKSYATRIKYFPSYKAAKDLGINGLTLSKLTASLHVICKSDQRINLGLNLKFEAKKQKVLGYTRKNKENGWEYSEKAMQILAEYKKKFPEFIQALENKHKDEIYNAEDFYPKEEAVSKIHAIKDWLKTIEVRDREKVSLEAEQLDKEAIQEIEKAADGFLIRPCDKHEIKNVLRDYVLKPSHASTLLLNQTFHLGDRVVFVKNSGSVPIASKGTIVGIKKTNSVDNVDVVFDTSFMSGSTLGNKCSEYRGMTVPANSLLNLTYSQLPEHHHRRRPNYGNGRPGTSSNHPFRPPQDQTQNGFYHNTYPYYNHNHNHYRGRGGGSLYPTTNHAANGSQRPSNRSRGNGYIQSSGSSSHHQYYIRSRPQPAPGATKHVPVSHNRSGARGSNGNGYSSRGNGNRGGHYGGSRGRGGKT